MDLFIRRVVDDKFVTGIFHKADDFNFEVMNYPFPQSNINSISGYTTCYSKPNRFFDFVVTSTISSFGQNLAIPSWPRVVTCIASCLNILTDSVLPTKYKKYMAKYAMIHARMIKYSPSIFVMQITLRV